MRVLPYGVKGNLWNCAGAPAGTVAAPMAWWYIGDMRVSGREHTTRIAAVTAAAGILMMAMLASCVTGGRIESEAWLGDHYLRLRIDSAALAGNLLGDSPVKTVLIYFPPDVPVRDGRV